MEIQEQLYNLKLKIQSSGALRNEAWQLILAKMKQKFLKTNESFVRQEDQLAYVAAGLFKEYTAVNRNRPSIQYLVQHNTFIFTRKYNKQHYLKASIPALVFYWDFESLLSIYNEFKELKPVYDTFLHEYDAGTAFRQQLLEIPKAEERLSIFVHRYADVLKVLKKKDIANYLNISYHYFVHIYNSNI